MKLFEPYTTLGLRLFDVFEKEGESLYVVGGAVRDLILSRLDDGGRKLDNIKCGEIDVDFATSALPEKTIQILKKNQLRAIPIGMDFGTIQSFIQDVKVEITTFRTAESYTKGSRKPSVVFGKTIEEDLARRDFTINAIAMDKDGNIVDPFNGVEDLKNGYIRTPLISKISFGDDPLRMLRCARFVSRFGFVVENFTYEGMCEMSEQIKNISSERVFEEMSKILMSDKPSVGLNILADTGVLKHAFPELQKVVDFKQNQGKWHSKLVWPHTLQVIENTPKILEVRWAALYHDVAKPQTYSEGTDGVHFYEHDWKGALIWDNAARRLRVSKEFEHHVHALVEEHLQFALLSVDGAEHCSDKALRRFAHRVGDKLDNLFYLSLADITSHKPDVVSKKRANCIGLKERIEKLLDQENIVKLCLPKGTGNILMEKLGLHGKQLGDTMKVLTQKLIDGELTLQSDFVEEAKKII